MAYTLAEATSFYTTAKEAYEACLKSQSYSIKDRELKRANLDILRNEMNSWKRIMDDLADGKSGKIKVNRHVIVDDDE